MRNLLRKIPTDIAMFVVGLGFATFLGFYLHIQNRVDRIVCDSVEWHAEDNGTYGGEMVATCTVNDVYGREITVHLID